jgi:fatty-acyl-CoA synthase
VGSVDDPPETRAGTSGVPLTGMEARVRDPVTGRECGPDEVGEFLHRGVSRMAYYHRDPETTAARIDAQGWFHTGDLVRRDAAGRFTFVSRLKDMLKVGGENVAAAEVEGRLAEHPAVGVVAVVGAPDARLGEVVAAYVELAREWRGDDPDALATELVAHCLAALAPFKAPRYVEFVDSWPMSGTKIQKGELRDRIADDLAARGVTEAPGVSRPAPHAAG